jgi:hypothetical protein
LAVADEADKRTDPGASPPPKKRLTTALLAVSDGKAAGDHLVDDVLLARQVNRILGGPFVAPWDLGDLPQDFLDVVRSLTVDLPAFWAARRQAEKKAESWRAELNSKRVH